MTRLTPSQFGICAWGTHPKDPADLLGRLKEVGLRKTQLHLHPVYADPAVWGDVQKILRDGGVEIVSGMMGSKGEDYTSLTTIRKTGGFVPDEHWEANLATSHTVAKTAKKLGLKLVSCHAGFLPSNKADASFDKLVKRIGQVAKVFGDHGVVLVFETGQEDADTLWQFLSALDAIGATNTGINFDPANMILYDKGDPIVSLKKVVARVKQVHIKDAVKTKTPGEWGTEVAIGDGQVDWPAFCKTLADADFIGDLVIEREAGPDRVGDIRIAIDRISKLM